MRHLKKGILPTLLGVFGTIVAQQLSEYIKPKPNVSGRYEKHKIDLPFLIEVPPSKLSGLNEFGQITLKNSGTQEARGLSIEIPEMIATECSGNKLENWVAEKDEEPKGRIEIASLDREESVKVKFWSKSSLPDQVRVRYKYGNDQISELIHLPALQFVDKSKYWSWGSLLWCIVILVGVILLVIKVCGEIISELKSMLEGMRKTLEEVASRLESGSEQDRQQSLEIVKDSLRKATEQQRSQNLTSN